MKTGVSCRVNETDCEVLNYRFPREEKLKGRDEIRKVFSERKGVSCPGARLLSLRNGLPYNRIAFTFSRKFGNAVKRNRSRRLSREAYRFLRRELRQGYDMVLLVYPEGNSASLMPRPAGPGRKESGPGREVLHKRMDQMRELFSRAGLLKFS